MPQTVSLPAKPLTAGALKWIAIAAMVLDHMAWAFLPPNTLAAMGLHTVGKITGPIMFYFIAEGNHYTKNRSRYLGRLALFALISHIPYNLFFNSGTLRLAPTSVIFTLLCGLLALAAQEKIRNKALRLAATALLAAATIWADWPVWGVLFILCFGLFYGDAKKQWAAYFIVNAFKIAFIAYSTGGNFYSLVPVAVSPLLVFGLLHLYSGKKGGGRYSKWAFYIAYPLHFFFIGGLRLWLG